MKLNIYVIDDDIAITDQLSHLIFEWAADRAVTVDLITKNGLSEAVPEEVSCFDLVILDVMIGDKNGIEYAKSLRELGSHAVIAFISNFSQYAINGYSAHAVSYLLKPLKPEAIYSLLDETVSETGILYGNRIHVAQSGKDIFLPPNSIIYIEAFRNQVTVHMKDREESFYVSMNTLEKQLSNTSLMRCHRSYIINLRYVREISYNNVNLYGIDHPIPLGRGFADDVRSRLLWKE